MLYLLLALGFIFVIGGAYLLVEGASALARRLKVPDLIIGLTIVAFGTSMPELVVNIYASLLGATDIAIGNILGSNIVNILLILGIAAIIRPLTVKADTVWKEIPLSFMAALSLAILSNDTLIDRSGQAALTRVDGLILLCFFSIFLYYIFSTLKAEHVKGADDDGKRGGLSIPSLFVIAGLICLYFGARWVVDGAVFVAGVMGMGERVIGLTIVAVGTSLPELATSAMAAFRKNADIAVGNIVGSNIFNIFFILGLSAVISPLPFSAAGNVDIAVTVGATMLLFIAMFTGRSHRLLERWEGILFILFYSAYIVYLIAAR